MPNAPQVTVILFLPPGIFISLYAMFTRVEFRQIHFEYQFFLIFTIGFNEFDDVFILSDPADLYKKVKQAETVTLSIRFNLLDE